MCKDSEYLSTLLSRCFGLELDDDAITITNTPTESQVIVRMIEHVFGIKSVFFKFKNVDIFKNMTRDMPNGEKELGGTANYYSKTIYINVNSFETCTILGHELWHIIEHTGGFCDRIYTMKNNIIYHAGREYLSCIRDLFDVTDCLIFSEVIADLVGGMFTDLSILEQFDPNLVYIECENYCVDVDVDVCFNNVGNAKRDVLDILKQFIAFKECSRALKTEISGRRLRA